MNPDEPSFHFKATKNGQRLDSVRVGTRDMNLFLTREYPDTHFSFILGSDTFNDLRDGKWKNSEELLKTLTFEVCLLINAWDTLSSKNSF